MARVAPDADVIHLDIMDGIFVPASTFTISQASEIIRNSPLPVDVHLMVVDVTAWAQAMARAGANSITFHYEAVSDPEIILQELTELGVAIGIGIKPGTKVDLLIPLLANLELALIMTVEPGAGGQAFMPEMMEKVVTLVDRRSKDGLNFKIQVDGGINDQTINVAARAGAENFVIGSAVYRAQIPAEYLQNIRRIWQTGITSPN
jgi:ribulose-phosphate 3-epimerase